MPGGDPALSAKLKRTLAFACLGGLFGAMLQGLVLGTELVEIYGLGWLFSMRGPIMAPPDAVIVSMDKTSARDLGLSPALPWPRTLHACLIEGLAQREVALIVFDIFFRPETPPTGGVQLPAPYLEGCPQVRAALTAGLDQNRILERAMLDSEKVMLLERIDQETIDLEHGVIIKEQLLRPTSSLAQAALAVAPFILPLKGSNVARFRDRQQLNGQEISSLPVMAARYVGHALSGPLATERPLGHGRSTTASLHPAAEHLLNFYGPAGNVCNVPFTALLMGRQEHGSFGCPVPLSLSGKTVFVGVGWSRIAASNQTDEFTTAFSNGPGKHITGVEILATAFLNLVEGDSIRPLDPLFGILVISVVGAVLGALIIWMPGLFSVLTVLGIAGLYGTVALLAFDRAGLWIPLLIPIAVQLPMTILVGLLFKYLLSRRAITRYVPPRVAERIANSGRRQAASEDLLGTCLCTDVAHYTSLSEQVSPMQLAVLTNRYFAALGACITQRGGEMLNIVGDGSTSVWPALGDHRNARLQACLAALEISRAVEDFNHAHPAHQFPTRIGLNSGWVAMGDFGGGGHYDYSIVGNTVNTASRLEGLNKLTGTRILAAHAVIQGLDEIQVRPVGRFQLKDKLEFLDVVEILARHGDLSPADWLVYERFAEALGVYSTGDWEQALTLFGALLHDYPSDGPSQFYYDRCLQHHRQPSSFNAGGIIKLDVK